MKNQLVITALISNSSILCDLFKLVQDCRCNVIETHMNTFGSENTVFMLIRGHWDAIVKIESGLNNLAKKLAFSVMTKRTEIREYETNLLPYLVHVVALDKPGIAHSVIQFFVKQKLEIQELEANCFLAHPTQTPLGNLTFTVLIPASLQIAELRENFMIFCDEINIDAILEPNK